ncbi:MAG: SpoIIE family protein phosphatase [Oscillospiraceae bacterium]|nr:SpoIIE family protein phosphatase [Oscillospiraceae bacterium]
MLSEISRQSRQWGVANTAYTHTINSFMLDMGNKADYCVCYQNHSKCIISTRDKFDSEQLNKIKLKLENIYGEKFADAVKSAEEENIFYTFCAVPAYMVEFGTDSKSRYSVCGDICEILHAEDFSFVIMADGMGTGSFAAAESRTVVTMLKSLLSSGVKVQTALEITNTALNLKGTGQACVALDILVADRYSGGCALYKAGGAASIMIEKNKIKRLYKDSLPIGILKDVKVAQFDFTLNNGDTIVLLSDGIALTEELICKTKLMAEKLEPQELSQLITAECAATDDATAAVFKFVRI